VDLRGDPLEVIERSAVKRAPRDRSSHHTPDLLDVTEPLAVAARFAITRTVTRLLHLRWAEVRVAIPTLRKETHKQ